MYMAGAWFAGVLHSEAPQIDGKWAAAPLPEGAAGCKTTIAGDALIMVAKDQNSDEERRGLAVDRVPVPARSNLAEWTYGSPDGTNLPAADLAARGRRTWSRRSRSSRASPS